MEAHFLSDTVDGEPEFRPEPWYNPHGDCIIHQVANEAVVAERIDELLTIYRSADDRRVIGYQIKGVRALVRNFGWDGLAVECTADAGSKEVREISIVALLLAAYEQGPTTVGRRSAYAQSLREAAACVILETELVTA
jgi:hypothetical protein